MKKKTLNKEQDICVGVITSVNGVKGYVKIRSFTADPSDLSKFKRVYDQNGNKSYNISIVAEKKGYVIAGIDGIKNRNEAEELRNTRLFINRSELQEPANDEYYHADLVGIEAKYEDGTPAGIVKEVVNFGAGDILEIYSLSSEKIMYYPFNKQFIPEVNLSKGYVVLSKVEETVVSEE